MNDTQIFKDQIIAEINISYEEWRYDKLCEILDKPKNDFKNIDFVQYLYKLIHTDKIENVVNLYADYEHPCARCTKLSSLINGNKCTSCDDIICTSCKIRCPCCQKIHCSDCLSKFCPYCYDNGVPRQHSLDYSHLGNICEKCMVWAFVDSSCTMHKNH